MTTSKNPRAQANHHVARAYACCEYESPVGTLTLAAGEDGLKGLWLQGQKYFGGTLDGPMEAGSNRHLRDARAWLDEYFAGGNPNVERLEVTPLGTPFRQAVWQLLRKIPQGQVCTYSDLAKAVARRLGKQRTSARAVGGAVGHNPISIIVPCHRVVGADGSLTGYAGGTERKRWLLEHEGVDCKELLASRRAELW